MILLPTLLLTGIFLSYQLDVPKIIYKTIRSQYYSFTTLMDVVEESSSTPTNKLRVLGNSMLIILRAVYTNIFQTLDNTVTQLDRKTYEIRYVVKGKQYRLKIKPARGPDRILLVCDDAKNDLTQLVASYAGPEYNFHGKTYRPSSFGVQTLTFVLSNGSERTFNGDDEIDLGTSQCT